MTPLRFVLRGLAATLRALAYLIVGAVGALLYALPWIVAAGSVLLWLTGLFHVAHSVSEVYGPGLTHIALWAIQGAAVLLGLSLPLTRLASPLPSRRDLVGVVAIAGAGEWLFAWALPRLMQRAPLETLLFPVALGLTLHVYATVRLKWLRHSNSLKEVLHEREQRPVREDVS